MKIHRLFSLVVPFALITCALPALANSATLSPQEIQSTWVDKTVGATLATSFWQKAKPFDIRLKKDGSAELAGSFVDSGTWRISDKGFCTTWKVIRPGEERCFTVVKNGEQTQLINPDGSVNATILKIN